MVLYHSSQLKNLKSIDPQGTLSNDKYIGDFVFATKKYKLALMYLVPKVFPILMEPDNDPNIVICSSIDKFNNLDQGGAIYSLPSTNFIESPQKAFTNYEMVSKESIRPKSIRIIDNTLDELLSNGVKVRFATKNKFNGLIGKKNQKELVASLPLYEDNSTKLL